MGAEFYKLIIIDFLLQLAWPFIEFAGKLISKISRIKFFYLAFDLESKFLDLLSFQMVCFNYFLNILLFYKQFFFFIKIGYLAWNLF